jgi:hypothetical protein
MRRLAGALGILATTLAFVITSQPAVAQEVPTVRIAGTTSMSETQQCFTEPTFTPGSFTLARSSASGILKVIFHVSGGPTDLNSDPAAGADHTATFADGQTQVTVTVHPALGGGQATVSIVKGSGYNIGSPSTATIAKSVTPAQCSQTPSTRPRNLARTGSPSTTFGLVLIAFGMIVAGIAMKRVADSRVR